MSAPSPRPQPFTVWHGLLLVEGAALAIALLMPLAPSKAGSGRGLAALLLDEPGYPVQVLVYFVMTNLLVAVLALAAWLWLRRGARRRV